MTPIFLLDSLKEYVIDVTRNLQQETKAKRNDEKTIESIQVFIGNPPVKDGVGTKYIPYIILRLLHGADEQIEGSNEKSTVKVRMIIATRGDNCEESYKAAINVIDRLRISLLKDRVIDRKYTLKMPVEYVVYEDDTGPFTIGEIITTWEIPSIRQEVNAIWH